MSQAHTIDSKRALFPPNWVIGTAAADLARNDPGVLLPGDPIPDDQREDQAVAAPPAVGNAHSRAAEIAALHAENERLRQRIMATRQRLRPLAERAALGRHGSRPGTAGMQAAPELPAARRPTAQQRREPGISRAAIAATLLVVAASIAGGWYVTQSSNGRSETILQARALGSDWQTGLAELSAKLASGSDALIARVDSMASRVSGLWTQASQRRAMAADAEVGGSKGAPAAAESRPASTDTKTAND